MAKNESLEGKEPNTGKGKEEPNNDKLHGARKVLSDAGENSRRAVTYTLHNPIEGSMTLKPTEPPEPTPIKALFGVIRNRTEAVSFSRYSHFIDQVMCSPKKGPLVAEVQSKIDILQAEIDELKLEVGKIPELQQQIDDLERRREELKALGSSKIDLRDTWQSPLAFRGAEAYELLKKATEYFLMQECGVLIDWALTGYSAEDEKRRIRKFRDAGMDSATIKTQIAQNKKAYLRDISKELRAFPYLKRIVQNLAGLPLKPEGVLPPHCYGILRSRVTQPCLLELIWSYWHEEGMLVQSINAISLRFQNRRGALGRDPLAHLDIDPLRPLNNLLWGYIQDEQHRLTLRRRAYEYDHQYGLRLYGKAVHNLQPADSRSKFLDAFHNLLHLCSVYYKEAADTTVVPDAFPIMSALKEVNLLLTEGMHNQYGDLPWTSRVEMLMQQWFLARPEMREFLGGRIMVPYAEPWMGHVDTMKKLQGWTDVTVRHFRDLGVFGEKILLPVRFGDWINNNDENDARLWADYWRQEIHGYIQAYRAVTGVDLTSEPVDSTLPSVLLRERLARQGKR